MTTSKKNITVWNKLFPLVIGDRVRIIKVSTYEMRHRPIFLGRTGMISWKHNHDIFVKFDHIVRSVFTEIHLFDTDVVRIKARKKK